MSISESNYDNQAVFPEDTPLHRALKDHRSIEEIRKLLDAGADINAKDKNGDTPLNIALQQWTYEDPEYNFFDENSRTFEEMVQQFFVGEPIGVLEVPATFEETVQLLLDAGADVNIPNNRGDTPLIIMLSQGGSDHCNLNCSFGGIIQKLIDAGADVNACNNIGDTPLLVACKHYVSSKLLTILIASGADVNCSNKNGITPLMAILKSDQNSQAETAGNIEDISLLKHFLSSELVTILLRAGTEEKIRAGTDRYTARYLDQRIDMIGGAIQILYDFYKNLTPQIAKLFLDAEQQAALGDDKADFILIWILHGQEKFLDYEMLNYLIDFFNSLTWKKKRLFRETCACNNITDKAIVRLFASAATEKITWLDFGMITQLFAFYDRQSFKAVKILLDAGADVNARDIWEQTPLMYAVGFNLYPQTVALLLSAGAAIDAKDSNHRGILRIWALRCQKDKLKGRSLLQIGGISSEEQEATLKLSYQFGQFAWDRKDYGMAKYFWNIYYKMTCDANIEKRLEELSSIIPEGNA